MYGIKSILCCLLLPSLKANKYNVCQLITNKLNNPIISVSQHEMLLFWSFRLSISCPLYCIINLIYCGMNSKTMQQFQNLYASFKTREQELSQDIRWKLIYIASKIHGRPLRNTEGTALQEDDVEDLEHLDSHALAVIFNTLVKSLLLHKNWQKQCKIKYSGFFESWRNAKITTEGKYLSINFSKICSKYELKLLTISNCRKTKRSFELQFKNKQLLEAKFASPQLFNEVSAHIQHSIDQAKGTNSVHKNQQSKHNLSHSNQVLGEQKMFEKDNRFNESVQQMNSPQKSPDKFDNKQEYQSTEAPVGYRIIEEDQNLLMCVNDKEAKLYTSLQIQTNCPLDRLVCYFTQQKEWNTVIAEENIQQQSPNTFQVFRLFKKTGTLFEKQRATFTRLDVNCSKNSASLQEESFHQVLSYEHTNCFIKTTTKFKRCMGAVRIVMDCQFNGKGYYQVADSVAMLINMFRELKFFENSFKIYQLQKSKPKLLIEEVPSTPRKIQTHSVNKMQMMEQSQVANYRQEQEGLKLEKTNSDLPKTDDSLDMPVKNELSKTQLMNKLRPLDPRTKITIDYIKLAMDLQFERGYLHHRFSEQILSEYDHYPPPYSLPQMLHRGGQYRITENKELVFIDEQLLNSQKDSLIFVIKQIGANIFSGKSVLNVSLPVDIFESRSLIQRSAASLGKCPDFLLPIANENPIYQMKKIVAFIATIPTLELLMQKPFNPILGETLQAYIKGIPIYYEQISHHPPISSYYMTCPEFTLYGNLVAFADVSFNSAVGGNEGIMHIILRNGSHFQCYFPPSEISGLIFGQRKFRGYGKGYVLEKEQGLFAEFSIEKTKKGLYQKGEQKLSAGDVIGGIFRVTKQFMNKVANEPSLRKFDGINKKDVVQKLSVIRGVWFEDIVIDGEVMNKNLKIYPLQYAKVALPSDANFRSDILFHKIGDLVESQHMKEILEVKQRGDRKLREKWEKANKKRK